MNNQPDTIGESGLLKAIRLGLDHKLPNGHIILDLLADHEIDSLLSEPFRAAAKAARNRPIMNDVSVNGLNDASVIGGTMKIAFDIESAILKSGFQSRTVLLIQAVPRCDYTLPRRESSRWDGPRPKGETTPHGRLIGLKFDNNRRSGQPTNEGPRPIYVFRPSSSRLPISTIVNRRAGLNMPRIPGAHH